MTPDTLTSADSDKMLPIFATETGIENLRKVTVLAVDGTMKTAPKPYFQLFVFQELNSVLRSHIILIWLVIWILNYNYSETCTSK